MQWKWWAGIAQKYFMDDMETILSSDDAV